MLMVCTITVLECLFSISAWLCLAAEAPVDGSADADLALPQPSPDHTVLRGRAGKVGSGRGLKHISEQDSRQQFTTGSEEDCI